MTKGLNEFQQDQFRKLYMKGYYGRRIREIMGLPEIQAPSVWMRSYRIKLGLLPRVKGFKNFETIALAKKRKEILRDPQLLVFDSKIEKAKQRLQKLYDERSELRERLLAPIRRGRWPLEKAPEAV